MMKIKFIRGHNEGQVCDRPERAAKTLIRIGLAEKYKEPKVKEEKEADKSVIKELKPKKAVTKAKK